MAYATADHTIYSDERELLSALRRGDRQSCEYFVKHYGAKIYNVAFRLMGDAVEAEDILQETFISACRNVPEFEGRSSLATWLYRIANNAALMRLRKKGYQEVPLDTLDDAGDEGEFEPPVIVADWSLEPSQVALSQDLHREMQAALNRLPEKYRLVFILRDIEGLSTAKVGEMLGVTETAVKVRLHRARLKLREELSAYFSEKNFNRDFDHGN